MNEEKLFKIASEARNNAYVPYSNFRVGAALLTKTGKIYTGCNIENMSYGATCCAERTAIFKAISEGERDFQAIAVKGDHENFTFPCGICRQVLVELAPNIKVILGYNNIIKTFSIDELLPYSFNLENKGE